MIVMTIDQRRSRRDIDRVDDLLGQLAQAEVVRPFERTAGDEVQGVLADAATVVDLAVRVATDGHWSIGIGIGAVETPLPRTTRAGRGEAFELARDAVEAAKGEPIPVAVRGAAIPVVAHAQTALRLLVDLCQSRSPAGAEAVAAMQSPMTQSEAAAFLGVSPQAISQRLRTARWELERPARELAVDLLAQADELGGVSTR